LFIREYSFGPGFRTRGSNRPGRTELTTSYGRSLGFISLSQGVHGRGARRRQTGQPGHASRAPHDDVIIDRIRQTRPQRKSPVEPPRPSESELGMASAERSGEASVRLTSTPPTGATTRSRPPRGGLPDTSASGPGASFRCLFQINHARLPESTIVNTQPKWRRTGSIKLDRRLGRDACHKYSVDTRERVDTLAVSSGCKRHQECAIRV
jgi:hypothetical protein